MSLAQSIETREIVNYSGIYMCIVGRTVINHQSWLLKTVGIELRITSLNRQRSHTQRLMRLLLDDSAEDQTSGTCRRRLYKSVLL